MININVKGILVDADFLLNYTSHNLSGEEALFLLQISYLTNQGEIPFSTELVKEHLKMTEKEIQKDIYSLYYVPHTFILILNSFYKFTFMIKNTD